MAALRRACLVIVALSLNAGSAMAQVYQSNAILQLQEQYAKKRYVLAEQLAREILRSEPTNIRVHYVLGNIYAHLDQKERARREYDYCLAVGGRSEEAKMALANLRTINSTQEPSPNPLMARQIDPKLLTRSLHILQKSQEILVARHVEAETMIAHSGEFARSRAREIPANLTQRHIGLGAALTGDGAAGIINYGRPAEVRALKLEQAKSAKRLSDAYERREKVLVDETISEVDKLIGADDTTSDTNSVTEPLQVAPKMQTLDAAQALVTSGITVEGGFDVPKTSRDKDKNMSGQQRVLQVATSSAAHRAGIIAGDLITQKYFNADQSNFFLAISRGGKCYQIVLHPHQTRLALENKAAQASKLKNLPVDNRKILREKNWARIRASEVIFMVDMSYNMAPLVGETGMGRFEWAAHQIADLAEKISDHNNQSFVISECGKVEYRLRDQNANGILRFLLGSIPKGAANMSAPLASIINEYIDSKKPVLIMIFTSGRFELGESLEPILRYAAEKVRDPEAMHVVFVQIGEEPDGAALMQMLDEDMPFTGTKYDIVDYITFNELQASGLSSALLDVYERPRAQGAPPPLPISSRLSKRISEIQAKLAH